MDNKTLSIEGIVSNSTELNKVSTELNDICTGLYSTITGLRDAGQFVSVTASDSYFESIDNLNQMVPKFTEAILRFSRFLSDYVLQNYTEVDQDMKSKIETNLNESLEKLSAMGITDSGSTLSSNGVDYSKIASTAQGALNGDFIDSSKVHKESFEGELEFVTRDDGSVMITKNGVPIGFTTQDGASASTNGGTSNSVPSAADIISDVGGASLGVGGAIAAATQSTDGGVATEGVPSSTAAAAPAQTGTSIDPGYTGETEMRSQVSTSTPSGTYVQGEHYAAQSYQLSDQAKHELMAMVAGEDSYTYEGALAVASTVLNRAESPQWKAYGGNDIMAQAKYSGQFSAWDGSITKACLKDSSNIPPHVVQAVEDALNGTRNHQFTRFRGNKNAAPGRIQIGENGNYYF